MQYFSIDACFTHDTCNKRGTLYNFDFLQKHPLVQCLCRSEIRPFISESGGELYNLIPIILNPIYFRLKFFPCMLESLVSFQVRKEDKRIYMMNIYFFPCLYQLHHLLVLLSFFIICIVPSSLSTRCLVLANQRTTFWHHDPLLLLVPKGQRWKGNLSNIVNGYKGKIYPITPSNPTVKLWAKGFQKCS